MGRLSVSTTLATVSAALVVVTPLATADLGFDLLRRVFPFAFEGAPTATVCSLLHGIPFGIHPCMKRKLIKHFHGR